MKSPDPARSKEPTPPAIPARPVLLALLAALLFGASTPLSKLLLARFDPFLLAGLLYLGAALAVSPAVLRSHSRAGRPLPADRTNRVRLAAAILCGGVLGPVLFLFGLGAAPAASASLWLNLETVATAILAVLFFRESLGAWSWAANLGVCLAGSLLALDGGWAGIPAALWVAGACLCWGMDNNLTAVIDGIDPVASTFWKGLAAGLVNTGIGGMLRLSAGTSADASTGEAGGAGLIAGPIAGPGAGTLLAAAAVGALAYGLSIALYIAAAQALGATRAQMHFAAAPFFGVALSAALPGEGLTPTQLAAAAILAASLTLLFLDRHEHEHVHPIVAHAHGHRHGEQHHHHEHPGLPRGSFHVHWHEHGDQRHAHPHWSDLHHRHG